jgi:hypothetical protein
MVRCSACGQTFAPGERVASISGSISGDECTESWYYCTPCQVYTVEVYWDVFLGEESGNVGGPIARAAGDEKVALIRRCRTPWRKTCRCTAHRAYFGNGLD